MKKINISNVEELLFYDSKIQNLLSHKFYSVFEQWKLSQRIPHLRAIGRQAVLDILNSLNEEDIEILEEYYKDYVHIEKINSNISESFVIPINNIDCNQLCEISGYKSYSSYRDKDNLYITFYR